MRMRKTHKVLTKLLVLVMLISFMPISKATADTIPPVRVIKIDMYIGQSIAQVNFSSVTLEQPATLVNGITVAPARFIAETMGATYNWNVGTQTISITKGATAIELQIGNYIAKVNGVNITLDQCAVLLNGIPAVPAQFVAEALGGTTEWNPNQNRFTITFEETLNSNQLKLPSFFANNMVIQRDLPIPVWGLAPTGSGVTVTLGNDTKTTTSQDGRWRVDLDAKAYGGPYTLLVSDGTTNLQYTNILIGDVFFCSGQSNMVVPLRNVTGGVELASTANHPNIRYFDTAMTDSDTPAFEPLSELKWQTITPTNASDLAAVAYLFARFASEGLNNEIPIGIYHSAVGSTSITSWLPIEVNNELGAVQTTDVRRPSAFYNAMVFPYFPTGLKGVVWYQGESSINTVELYSQQLTAMMNDYRNKTNIPSLPIFYPQLPRYNYTAQPLKWAEMREMQQIARDSNENFYMGVNIDLGEETNIHPADKVPLAQRLANLALKHLYNKPVIADAPFMKSNTLENNKIVIDFTNSEDGIIIQNVQNSGIEIAGENEVFVPANAQMVNNKLSVWADSISSPKYVRYAFSNYPDYSLFSNNGLPVAPFRIVPDALSLTPTADGFINGVSPNADKNYAMGVQLNLNTTTGYRALMRFNLPSNLNVNDVNNITLKLYTTVPATYVGRVFNVFKISNSTWEEGTGAASGTSAVGIPGITYTKSINSGDAANYLGTLSFTTPLAASTGADGTSGVMIATIPTSAITQADVTAGAVSFIVRAAVGGNLYVHSKKSTNTFARPKLDIFLSTPTADILTPAADGFINGVSPNADKNYAMGGQLNLNTTTEFRALMRFNLPSNLNVNDVSNITLKLYTTVPATYVGRVFNVFKISNITWEEGTGAASGTSAVGIPGITYTKSINSGDALNYLGTLSFTTPLAASTGADVTTGLMVATIPTSAITQADVTAGAVSFIVRGAAGGNWYVHSNKSLTTAARPKLEIIY